MFFDDIGKMDYLLAGFGKTQFYIQENKYGGGNTSVSFVVKSLFHG